MAIYHLHAQVFKRSSGKNAVASAAYRRAAKFFDQNEQREWDYSNKPDVIHSELLIPDHSPEWVKALLKLHEIHPDQAVEHLWNLVEENEKRVDAQVAREIEFALPIELDQEQNIILAREFIKDQLVSRGMIADWNIHWDESNPHVHVMLTLRDLREEGFGLKVREWNQKSLLEEWRRQWSAYANFHLKLHQHEVSIDHRSYADQGIDLVPTLHQGKAVSDMESRGIKTGLMVEANDIRRENLSRIAADPKVLLKKLSSQTSTFTHDQISQELGRYINDQGKFSYPEKGILAESILKNSDDKDTSYDPDSVLTIEAVSKIIQSIEHHESVFKERYIAKAVAPYTNHSEAFAKALIQIKTSHELIHLGVGNDGRERFTTRSMFQLENEIQQLADRMRNRSHLKIGDRHIRQTLDAHQRHIGKELTAEQREAVQHILSSSAISCLVGRAGTGKSFSLGAAKVVWEKQGCRVQGIALSGIAASGLNKDAGISSRTIESFRYALLQNQIVLDQHDVIVMDEAGMTDSVAMHAVLKAVETARAKLVLVGDHAQLQPVGPGASFRALVERLGFKEIQTVYRQKETWQREATVAFSSGHISEGLAAYEANHSIHFEKTAESAISRLVNDWCTFRTLYQKPLSEYLVVAHRNEDVNCLNQLLREQRVRQGEIAEGYLVNTRRGEIKIAQNDRILFLKNDRHLGVTNGRFSTIQSVNFTESGKVLDFTVLLDGTNKAVCINPSQYADFTYGYASTVHKVQGMTVDHSFVYAGGSSWNRHLTYVALSRHRQSVHLYADQKTHPDFKTLQRHLGRFGIKDSVLDFPLAFAERRGIETNSLLKRLPQHLAERLATLKEKVATQIEQFFDPVGYAQRREGQRNQQLKNAEIALRREDAKCVAAYVDANRQVGLTWQALQTRLRVLGLDKMSFEAQAFSLISGTSEYAAFQRALQERNTKAFQIIKELTRYQRAVDLHGLDIERLQQQAGQYACSERVKEYLYERKRGAVVHRDRLAAQIMPEMKQHYPYLKSLGVDGQEIKHCVNLHLKRQLLTKLNVEERAAFRTVERYQSLTRQIGEQWGTIMKVSKTPAKRFQWDRLNKLNQERDQLAYQILTHRQYYDKALDFYQIGRVALPLGENPEEKQVKRASVRGSRLQQQAARYELQKRVAAYHQALFVGDQQSRQHLAHEIIQDTKAHHGAVVNLSANTTEVWRAIRIDAKLYDRHQYALQFNEEERHRFQLIESYVEAKQAHARAWREVFESKKAATIDEKALYTHLAPYAARYTKVRNELADQVVVDLDSYAASLDYFKITPEELQAQSYVHQCRVAVDHYLQASTLLIKSQHALAMVADPKAYHGAVVENGLQWRELYKISKIAERKILFEQLSFDEKSLYRLADRYRNANQKVGKTFSVFKKTGDQALLEASKHRVELLLAKRDYLAWKLVNAAYELHPNALKELAATHHLNADKLLQQHAQQVERLTQIDHWESSYQQAIQSAQVIYVQVDESQEVLSRGLQKTFAAIEQALQLQKIYRFNEANFHYALSISGLSVETLNQKTKGIGDLKEHLQSLAALKQIDKKQLIKKPILRADLLVTQTTDQRIDIKRLREDLNVRADEVTQHYLGDPKARSGTTWRYGSHQGSLVVNVSGQKQGLWHDFQLGVGGDMLSLIQQTMETSDFKAVLSEAARFVGGSSCYQQPRLSSPRSAVIQTSELDDHTLRKIQKAHAIFQASKPISGTLAERYLREHRGISVPLDDKTLRYHPHLKNWMTGGIYPALVVAARDEKDQICGLQAIFLDPITAQKAGLGHHTKLSRGLIGEGALVHLGSPSGRVAFAEGVETALSVASAHPDWKVYTTFGVANFDKVPLKAKSSDIILCADNDGLNSGTAKSVERAANILARQGVNVWLAEPQKPEGSIKWDFNDALRKQGIAQVKTDLDQAKLYKKGMTQERITQDLSTTLNALGHTPQETAVELSMVPILDTASLSYEVLLTRYAELEVQQTQLVHAMYAAKLKDPKAGRELATQQAITHANTIKAFAAQVTEHPEFKLAMERLKKEPKPASLAQRGGFIGIAERLKQGKIVPEDVKALTLQLRNTALEHQRSQVRSRDRGGRTRS